MAKMTKGKTRGNAAVLGSNKYLKRGGTAKIKKYGDGGSKIPNSPPPIDSSMKGSPSYQNQINNPSETSKKNQNTDKTLDRISNSPKPSSTDQSKSSTGSRRLDKKIAKEKQKQQIYNIQGYENKRDKSDSQTNRASQILKSSGTNKNKKNTTTIISNDNYNRSGSSSNSGSSSSSRSSSTSGSSSRSGSSSMQKQKKGGLVKKEDGGGTSRSSRILNRAANLYDKADRKGYNIAYDRSANRNADEDNLPTNSNRAQRIADRAGRVAQRAVKVRRKEVEKGSNQRLLKKGGMTKSKKK